MENTVKSSDKAFQNNLDTVIICLSLCVPSVYYGGLTAFVQILSCVVFSAMSEFIAFKLVLKKNPLYSLNAVATGLIIALLLPSSAPLYVGICACVFAVLVSKLPFGGAENAPFVPSAVGIAFAVMTFREAVSTYPASSSGMNLIFYKSENFVAGADLASMLSKGDGITMNVFGRIDLFSGSLPGAMGTTCILALLGCAVYLFIKQPERLHAFFGYVAAVAAFAFVFPRVNFGRFSSVIMELCAGGVIFTALLLINEPVTSPKMPKRAFIYGAVGGILLMMLRNCSEVPLPEVFSVLLMNALWPALTGETVGRKVQFKKKRKAPSFKSGKSKEAQAQ